MRKYPNKILLEKIYMICQVKGYTRFFFIYETYLEDSHPFMLNKNKITQKSFFILHNYLYNIFYMATSHFHFGYIILKHESVA